MAKLMQIHHATHPDRVGRLFGVTSTYVRAVWSRTSLEDQPSLAELAKCEELRELIRQGIIPQHSPEHDKAVETIYELERRNGK